MPNYAIIKNGEVVDIVVAETNYAAEQGWVELGNDAGIGWNYANGVFVDNRPKPDLVAEPAEPTKEQLMAELAALTAKIQALE